MKQLSERRCLVLKAKEIATPWKKRILEKPVNNGVDVPNGKTIIYLTLSSLVVFLSDQFENNLYD